MSINIVIINVCSVYYSFIFQMTSSARTIPLVLGSLLGVMLATLCVVLFLFYKKRKESLEFKAPLEKMTRGLRNMSAKGKKPQGSSGSSNDSIYRQVNTVRIEQNIALSVIC